MGANLWPCRQENYEPTQWWCGDPSVTPICQSGNQGYLRDYTSGSILGFPPISSSPSAATQSSCGLATTTFYASASCPIKMSTAPSLSAQTLRRSTNLPTDPPASTQSQEHSASLPVSSPTDMSTAPSLSTQTQRRSTNPPTGLPGPAKSQERSASLPTAIGFGVGIPLGIAAIGFLGFLFWRAAERERKSKSRILSQEHALGNGDQSASVVIDRLGNELPDAQLPSELDDTGKRELPGM